MPDCCLARLTVVCMPDCCPARTWLWSCSAPDCCPAVPGSNPASPQLTADCQSSGGLPPGMALRCRLTSVRGDRGENMRNELLVRQKHIKEKKNDVRYRILDKSLFRYPINVGLCELQSDSGRFEIRLISMIADIGLSAHLWWAPYSLKH
jgi:hypothetical protein